MRLLEELAISAEVRRYALHVQQELIDVGVDCELLAIKRVNTFAPDEVKVEGVGVFLKANHKPLLLHIADDDEKTKVGVYTYVRYARSIDWLNPAKYEYAHDCFKSLSLERSDIDTLERRHVNR